MLLCFETQIIFYKNRSDFYAHVKKKFRKKLRESMKKV